VTKNKPIDSGQIHELITAVSSRLLFLLNLQLS
jgi:hypothetical protein